MTVYKIVNPSDTYTMRAPSDLVAAITCIVLGSGRYGLESEDGHEVNCPLFMFGGNPDDWAKMHGSETFLGLLTRATWLVQVEAAMRSVMIGGFDDRRLAESATEKMASQDAKEWLASKEEAYERWLSDLWHDRPNRRLC